MKNRLLLLMLGVSALGLVYFAGYSSGQSANAVSAGDSLEAAAEKQPLYWVAPMDKNYRRDGPGQSPMGMDLVPVYEDAADDSSVTISPVVENNLGVKVAPVRKTGLVFPIDTVGTVQYDESRIRHIHSRAEGWIERLGVSATGDRVKKGQVLYEFYSPTLISAQEEYLAALRSKNTRLIKASGLRLESLGLDKTQIQQLKKHGLVQQNIQINAEFDGHVKALNVRKGMHIKPDTEVMSIASLNSVWLLGEVFERQAYAVQQGQDVVAQLPSQPSKDWSGMVNYVYPELDSQTRTLPVRVRLMNKDQALKPNMLMTMQILDRSSAEVLSVPRSAVIKAGKHARVVKSLGDGRFKSVVVMLGREGELHTQHDGDSRIDAHIEILSGLNTGDVVVTSAQFLIDSESNIEAELQRMEEASLEGDSKSGESVSKDSVRTTGLVNKRMDVMGMVNITHEPIPEWDWGTMTMDFSVDSSIALSEFQEGETLSFELTKQGDWEFVITALIDENDHHMDHEMNHEMHHDMDHAMDHEMDHEMHHDMEH